MHIGSVHFVGSQERENDITEAIDVGNTPFATQRATIATLPLTVHPQNITGMFSRENKCTCTSQLLNPNVNTYSSAPLQPGSSVRLQYVYTLLSGHTSSVSEGHGTVTT